MCITYIYVSENKEETTMSFHEQTFRRKVSIFRQALRFSEIGAGVFVQRIPVRYLSRLHASEAEDDPVVEAIQNLEETFSSCREKEVDVASSVEALIEEFEANKIDAHLLLAWKIEFDATSRQMADPKLVGIATLSQFVPTPSFSTDERSISSQDFQTLRPHFGSKWLYIDAMCSKAAGVGRLLVLHAYNLALTQRKEGVIALSYSPRRASVPESKKVFSSLGFEAIIPSANFKVQKMYGTWFRRKVSEVDLAGLAEEGVRVCTRTGLTARTASTLMWRCPG